MPHIFQQEESHLTARQSSVAATGMNNLRMDQASIFAFLEIDPNAVQPATAQQGTANAWQSAAPSFNANRPQPRPRSYDDKVAFTGVVDVVTQTLYLCPLVAARKSRRYAGPLRYAGRDLTPVDHFSGYAFDVLLGPGAGKQMITAAKQNPGQPIRLGRPGVTQFARNPITTPVDTHRIAGTRGSSAGTGQRTFDPGNAALGFWDSAGHRELARRLGHAANPDRLISFAIEKNGIDLHKHRVLLVSRLNMHHFGVRGMTSAFAKKITGCLEFHIR